MTQFIELHPAQENVFYAQHLCPKSPAYLIGGYMLIDHAQPQMVEQAWQLLVKHIDTLQIKLSLKPNFCFISSVTRSGSSGW